MTTELYILCYFCTLFWPQAYRILKGTLTRNTLNLDNKMLDAANTKRFLFSKIIFKAVSIFRSKINTSVLADYVLESFLFLAIFETHFFFNLQSFEVIAVIGLEVIAGYFEMYTF